jgi:TPR repeat protein
LVTYNQLPLIMKKTHIIFSAFYLSCFFLFVSCLSSSESETVKELKIDADNGHAIAQYLLGGAYYFGKGTSVDNDKALEWFEKSAEQNNSDAQYYLGMMSKNGDGISQNDVQAFFWFKKSAEQNDADAQYELANIYDLGKGTLKDKRNAIYWYEKSVEQGNEEAEEYLRYMLNFIGEEELPNDKESIKNCEKLANQESHMAQYYFGLLHLNGIGVEKNMIKTKYWIGKSIASGNSKAQEVWDDNELWMFKDIQSENN